MGDGKKLTAEGSLISLALSEIKIFSLPTALCEMCQIRGKEENTAE